MFFFLGDSKSSKVLACGWQKYKTSTTIKAMSIERLGDSWEVWSLLWCSVYWSTWPKLLFPGNQIVIPPGLHRAIFGAGMGESFAHWPFGRVGSRWCTHKNIWCSVFEAVWTESNSCFFLNKFCNDRRLSCKMKLSRGSLPFRNYHCHSPNGVSGIFSE